LAAAALQVQLERLTAQFQQVTDDMKRKFVVDGEPLFDESNVGSSPLSSSGGGSFRRQFGFLVPERPVLSSSGWYQPQPGGAAVPLRGGVLRQRSAAAATLKPGNGKSAACERPAESFERPRSPDVGGVLHGQQKLARVLSVGRSCTSTSADRSAR
jgi:hypothetical protein